MKSENIAIVFFFFLAEDGIRDDLVTGVQTCALPISHLRRDFPSEPPEKLDRSSHEVGVGFIQQTIDDACSRANVVANDLQIEPLRDLAQATKAGHGPRSRARRGRSVPCLRRSGQRDLTDASPT